MSKRHTNMLEEARIYLSGPMDFVASRAAEKQSGWRTRVSQFLKEYKVTVLDPWYKPVLKGLGEFGREDENSMAIRDQWTFEDSAHGAKLRADCCRKFRPVMHIDLRMVDVSDALIAYCPTNIYSVGTPHEIVVARQQHKPVMFVSPPINNPALHELREHLKDDQKALDLLKETMHEASYRENPSGLPSMWYMSLVGTENFFDGFGFAGYRDKFGWEYNMLDEREEASPPARPLLPYLEAINNGEFPQRWNDKENSYHHNHDWLLLDVEQTHD